MDRDRPLSGVSRYGNKYWCIKCTASRDGEIYLMADRLEITEAGALIVWGGYRAKTNDAPNPDTQSWHLLRALASALTNRRQIAGFTAKNAALITTSIAFAREYTFKTSIPARCRRIRIKIGRLVAGGGADAGL
jgi:hypothetical protein